MNFGYACINLSIKNGSPNKRVTYKKLKTLSRDEQEKILYDKSKQNVEAVKDIIQWNIDNKVNAYRLSSDMFPLATHESVVDWWEPTRVFEKELTEIGKIANENKILLSLHPGQFTVLTSKDEELTKKSITDLKHHYNIMKALGLDYTPIINIHGGGKYGDPEAASERFVSNWDKVPYDIRDMITLENDQHIYNPDDILELCRKIKVPMVFDIAHWEWNKGTFSSIEQGLDEAFKTWSKTRHKKIHVSSQKENMNRHAHADYIEEKDIKPIIDYVKRHDENTIIMLECKMKNEAINKLKQNEVI